MVQKTNKCKVYNQTCITLNVKIVKIFCPVKLQNFWQPCMLYALLNSYLALALKKT